MQKNVIFLRELGSQIHLDRFTTTRAVLLLKLIRTVWRMGALIRSIFIGGGSPRIVNCLSSIQWGFWRLWGTNLGHLLVIRSPATKSSHYSAFSQRCVSVYCWIFPVFMSLDLDLKIVIGIWEDQICVNPWNEGLSSTVIFYSISYSCTWCLINRISVDLQGFLFWVHSIKIMWWICGIIWRIKKSFNTFFHQEFDICSILVDVRQFKNHKWELSFFLECSLFGLAITIARVVSNSLNLIFKVSSFYINPPPPHTHPSVVKRFLS